MASDQTVATGSQPPAQVVGNAFVQQFYHILHQSPQLVHRFYLENSQLGRPDDAGNMKTVTTMQAINEKMLAMDYSGFRAEIKTVDAQESLDGGVIVLVTGYLTGKDLVKKDFTQSFFLAPQDKGYFVLNDIFRYVDENVHQMGNGDLANGTVAPLSSEHDALLQEEAVCEQPPSSTLEDDEEENGEEVYNPPEEEDDPIAVEEDPVEEVSDEVPSGPSPVVHEASHAPAVLEDAPKKSYASIVKVMKENTAPLSVAAPAPARPVPAPARPAPAPATPAPANQERHSALAPVPAQVPEPPADSSTGPDDGSGQEAEADGYSIYVKSLPLSATPAQLEEEFKKFGPIKPGGIQVRSNKLQGFCFGFVQFEVATAVESAIKASPIIIGGRKAFVEEKRPATTRDSGRGRFPPGRGAGFRGDGMRGRGSYGSGRGFGRGDYNNRAEFGNGGGGRGGYLDRGGDVGYQRVDHVNSGGGRGGRFGNGTGNTSPKGGTPLVPDPA